jgi:predicted ATPase/DNA-binding XRE family transcriptional regulator
MATARLFSFGDLLRHYRLAAGLTLDELAERAGLSAKGIGALERGERRVPHRETVKLLADALQLPPAERIIFETAARRPHAVNTPSTIAASSLLPIGELPISPTPLIGREREEAALGQLLRSDDVRLLTLTGPPGVGKTSLALQVAVALDEAFAGDVTFVGLATMDDAAQVLPTISHALGLTATGDQQAANALRVALRSRRLLLVLDNVEQVLGVAPDLAALLAACPRLKLLVTSRAPLHLRAEHEFPVSPLAAPDPSVLPPLDDLARYSAVALFIQRARAVKPEFEMIPEHAPSVAAICTRLDGLPLAIELAAARVKLFSPPALLARLDRRLSLLTEGPRDLPERQRTLERAIAWSYDLLDERDQRLFQRLAVFVAGCDLAAAESICGADGHADSMRNSVLEGLASLVDKSLVVRDESVDGEARFRMLETLREYALERLAASGEEDAVRKRHADYYLALAETTEPELSGTKQHVWVGRLDVEHDNLRAALNWWSERGEVDRALRMAAALGPFWFIRGYYQEGRRWLERLVAQAGDRENQTIRAEALLWASNLAWLQDDQRAERLAEQGLALARAAGDYGLTSRAVSSVGVALLDQGRVDQGVAYLEESVALARKAGGIPFVVTLENLWLGRCAQGRLHEAQEVAEEGLRVSREIGFGNGELFLLLLLAATAALQGDAERARPPAEYALKRFREEGHTHGVAFSLAALAAVAAVEGKAEQAARLIGAQRALLGGAAGRLPVEAFRLLNMLLDPTRRALGEEAWAKAETAGSALSLDNVIREAIGLGN